MNTSLIGKSLILSVAVLCALATAAQSNDGALLSFKVSSEAMPNESTSQRNTVEGSVLVAFGEKFAMGSKPFRVELTAVNGAPSASVTVTLFDTRSEPSRIVGTEKFAVPVAGSNTAHLLGADGTAYTVAVQFKIAQLPAGKP